MSALAPYRERLARHLARVLERPGLEHAALVRAAMGLTEAAPARAGRSDYAAFALLAAETLGAAADAAQVVADTTALVHGFVETRLALQEQESSGAFAAAGLRSWGMPRVLNAADAMVALAHLRVLDLDSPRALAAASTLDDGLLELGHALEAGGDSGSGAARPALMALAAALASIAAGADQATRERLRLLAVAAGEGKSPVDAAALPGAWTESILAGLREVAGGVP